MFKKLLAILIYYKHNTQMLHWKTCGASFQENHTFLGELYDTMQDHIDEVAELGLQIGQDPLSLQDTLTLLDNDEYQFVGVNPVTSYPANETFTLVLTMFKDIVNEIEGICKNNDLTEAQKNDLGAISSWYSLRVNYLIPRRLM